MIRAVLVDDHPVFRRGLRALLESAGIEIVGETARGREAAELAARTNPDIVLMDLGLADLDGVAATERVLATCPDTHVLVVTMYDDDGALARALEAGARGYVAKDAPPEEVVRAVQSVADGAVVLGATLAPRLRRMVAGGAVRATSLETEAFPELGPRERQVLGLVAMGLTNNAIAERLGVSGKTVANYVSTILSRLGVPDRAAATRLVNERRTTS
jgi:DNA-binding NarL/FixJ family response regulator